MGFSWPWGKKTSSNNKILWVDLGDLGDLVHPSGPHEQWQDHGLGLLRTIMHQDGIMTDMVSTRAVTAWEQLAKQMQGYEMLLMNVRSYTFPVGLQGSAGFSRKSTPTASSSPAACTPPWRRTRCSPSTRSTTWCRGRAKRRSSIWCKDPAAYPRLVQGVGAKSMAEWPMMDRELWPKPRRLAHAAALEVEVAAGA